MDARDVEELAARVGARKTRQYLAALGAKHIVVRMYNTEVGKTLMAEAMNRTDEILKKIVTEDASDEELAEYRVLKRILSSWAGKIEKYYEILTKMESKHD